VVLTAVVVGITWWMWRRREEEVEERVMTEPKNSQQKHVHRSILPPRRKQKHDIDMPGYYNPMIRV
jgi:hypothetical protein